MIQGSGERRHASVGMDASTSLGMHKESGSQESDRIAKPKSSLGCRLRVQAVYIVLRRVSTTGVKAKSLHYESELES